MIIYLFKIYASLCIRLEIEFKTFIFKKIHYFIHNYNIIILLKNIELTLYKNFISYSLNLIRYTYNV